MLINILQVYNWFSKRYIQVILILYFLMQFLGYLTPVDYLVECQYAPHPYFYYAFAFAFLVLSVLDCWVFYFHPLQKDIFFDQEMFDQAPATSPKREAANFGGIYRLNSMNDIDTYTT